MAAPPPWGPQLLALCSPTLPIGVGGDGDKAADAWLVPSPAPRTDDFIDAAPRISILTNLSRSCSTEGLWHVVRNFHSAGSSQSTDLLAFHLFPWVMASPGGIKGNYASATFPTPLCHHVFRSGQGDPATAFSSHDGGCSIFSAFSLDWVTTVCVLKSVWAIANDAHGGADPGFDVVSTFHSVPDIVTSQLSWRNPSRLH